MTFRISDRRQKSTKRKVASQALLSEKEFLRHLDQLASRWDSNQQADLHLRHETGVLLNNRFGSPAERQSHGEHVMAGAAEKLGKTEAELYQVRWFAHCFKSMADLVRQFPKVKTWTGVRDLLPSLRQRKKGKKAQTRKVKRPNIRPITTSLATLTKALGRQHDCPTEDTLAKLVAKFQELSRVKPAWLPIQIVVLAKSKRKAG